MATNLNQPKDIDFENQDNIVFWQKAQDFNVQNPWYIWQRNDYLVNKIAKNYTNYDEANTALSNFINQAKTKNTWVWEQDWNNTQTNISNLLKTKFELPAEKSMLETVKETIWQKPTIPTVWAVPQIPQTGQPTTPTPTTTGQPTQWWVVWWLEQWFTEEQKKLKEDQTKAIADQYKSYNLAKADYEKNKNYFTNYDEYNNKFNNVINSLQTLQSQYPDKPLTDDQYQQIASQYWLSIDEVKNPMSIFNKLTPTEEGKSQLWITDFERWLEDSKTKFERQKQDLNTNITNVENSVNNNIADIEKKAKQDVQRMEAMWAATGLNMSSAFWVWLQNIKDNSITTVNRLKEWLQQTKEANLEDLNRLTTDYNIWVSRTKQDFDKDFTNLKYNYGLQLNSLSEKYWLGNKTLGTALDAIMKEYWMKSADLVTKYAQAFNNLNKNASDWMTLISQANDLQDKIENKRYNEYLDNNWILLQNTSLKTLYDEVQNWTLSIDKFNDLRNIITTSITSTLWKSVALNTWDLQTINSLLSQWKTPSEIVALFQEDERFKPQEKYEYKTFGNEIFKLDSSWNIVEKIPLSTEQKPITVWKESMIYDPITKKFISPTSTEPINVGSMVDWYTVTQIWNWETKTSQDWTFSYKDYGVDLAGKLYDPITSYTDWKIIASWTAKWWWNYVLVETPTWEQIRYSHLNSINPSETNIVTKWQEIGKMWSSWNSTWVHVDITAYDANWNPIKWSETLSKYIKPSTWWDYYSKLDSIKQLQAKNLSTKLFWKKNWADTKNINLIAQQLYEWKSINNIEDDLRMAWYWQEFTWDIKSAFNNVTQKMSDKLKTENQQQLEDLVSTYWKNSNQVSSFLKNLYYNNIDAATATKLKWKEDLLKQLWDIQLKLQQYQAKWWQTNIFNWSIEDIANKLWTVSDPELRKLATQIKTQIQSYRNAITWAAFSESEAKEYNDLFPNIKSDNALNMSKIEWIRNWVLNTLDTYYWLWFWDEAYNNLIKNTYWHAKWNIDYKDWTKMEYDWKGNYRWYDWKNWTNWTPEWQDWRTTTSTSDELENLWNS